MRLADDTRGRVPFALIGVLLLLGSTTYATTLATDGVRVDRDVEVAMDRATAASETTLRAAVTRAARDAARTPVVDPATNQWGDTLDASHPFRDALRVRIYAAARAGFERTAYTHGDVTAAATLPPTPTSAALSRALDRVRLTSVENGTALRVTIRNVAVVARERGRVVARERTNRTVTVATPVLALHDRTADFEQSLNRNALDGPGLERQLTARLYPVAWARGYAQWGGAPISNVVGTRHVGISANGAVLELQRRAYGRADPGGLAGQKQARVRLAQQELRAGTTTPAFDYATAIAGDPSLVDPDDAPRRVPQLSVDTAPTPDHERRVAVNGTADHAFVSFSNREPESLVADSNSTAGRLSLAGVLSRAYEADLRLRTHVEQVEAGSWPQPRPPTPTATLVNETVELGETVDAGFATLPPPEDGWTRLRTETRHVTVRHHIERTWIDDGSTVSTSHTVTRRYTVGLAVDGRPTRLNGTPEREIVPVFERGGALDGPNLVDVPNETGEFFADRGGVDSVAARRVVDGAEALERNGSAVGSRPPELSSWVTDDLVALNREVRNASTTVRMGDVAVGSAAPAARLSARLDERRAALLDAPETYDGVADRARVAARAAYLDRVQYRLQRRSNATERANERLADRLRANHGVDLPGRARALMGAATDPSPPAPTPASISGPLGGDDVFVPQGGPAYLDVQGVDLQDEVWSRERGTAYPMQTRNINVFTVPYGDAVEAVVGADSSAADGNETVRLHTAAVTLYAVERASDTRPELRKRRAALNASVAASLRSVGNRTRGVLATETTLSRQERTRVVSDAFSRWSRPSTRALAVTNGSFARAVVAATDVTGVDAVRLRIHLRSALASRLDSEAAMVDVGPVNSTVSVARDVSTTAATEALGTAAEAEIKRLDDAKEKAIILPAGLPLLPTPTNWYATVNLWVVRVNGQYPRFAVRTQRGIPGETVTYVRDGADATLDIDGDGDAERLGRASRIEFSVRTVIVVAVPPGKTGVGDTDGQASETSPGWGSEWDVEH